MQLLESGAAVVGAEGRAGGLLRAGLLLVAAIAVQVTLMPAIRVGSFTTTPDLVIVTVVALAVLRGVVVGAVAGFAGGLAVELMMPGETLGVLAFAGVVVGAWCGRFAQRSEPLPWWGFVSLAGAAAAFVPFWLGLVELLRGAGPPLKMLLDEVVVPQGLGGLVLALPVWWVARRLLGSPSVVEPGMMRG